ncbi:peptidoglycan DD-metalloendopeptidase family protein [Ruminococcus sp.]|uniref:peptidoglycan DD-metalloendopeptidase family protein n=1 Tax=Ruminococcus sp. TaxID=41978 RepID=UPI003F0F875F
MKKSKSSASNVLAGKGFYIALSLCVAMVGAACYFAYTQTSNDLSAQLESSLQSEQSVSFTKENVPKATTTAASTTTYTRTTVAEPAVTEAMVPAVPESTAPQTTAAVLVHKPEPAPKPVMPVKGEVINPFSNRELVKSPTTGAWQTHNGADLAAEIGDDVVSIAAGTVKSVEEDGLFGVCVTIDHGNGIISRYCNLNSGVTVTAGDELKGGDVIGAVGDTAEIESAEPSHLHIEIYRDGVFIDPVAYIQGKTE